MSRDIKMLKENLKKGTISYFSLNKEEIRQVANSLVEEIKTNKKEIEAIRNKINAEKRKLENSNL